MRWKQPVKFPFGAIEDIEYEPRPFNKHTAVEGHPLRSADCLPVLKQEKKPQNSLRLNLFKQCTCSLQRFKAFICFWRWLDIQTSVNFLFNHRCSTMQHRKGQKNAHTFIQNEIRTITGHILATLQQLFDLGLSSIFNCRTDRCSKNVSVKLC